MLKVATRDGVNLLEQAKLELEELEKTRKQERMREFEDLSFESFTKQNSHNLIGLSGQEVWLMYKQYTKQLVEWTD